MSNIHIGYYKKNGVDIVLGLYESKLCLLDFRYRKLRQSVDNRLKKGLNAEFVECEDDIILQTKKQLDEYFEMKRKEFTIPLLFVKESNFQINV